MNPETIYETVRKSGEEWADKDAAASLLEETRNTVLAELGASVEGSAAAKKAKALADPAYRLHVTQMVTARKEANKARVRYDSAKLLAELRRSEESTKRAEMQLR